MDIATKPFGRQRHTVPISLPTLTVLSDVCVAGTIADVSSGLLLSLCFFFFSVLPFLVLLIVVLLTDAAGWLCRQRMRLINIYVLKTHYGGLMKHSVVQGSELISATTWHSAERHLATEPVRPLVP